MARPDSRQAILDAAETIVGQSGAARMTLDAVAKRSGVSKGGLIYHFPTKEALLQAMIDRMMKRADLMREEIRKKYPDEGSNHLAVEMRVFQQGAQQKRPQSVALLAAIAANPDLTSGTREEMSRHFNAHIASPRDFHRSAILFLAALGMHFLDLLNLSFLTKEQKEEIQKELLRLAKSGEGM